MPNSYVYQNELRERLHNKRSEPYGFGKDTVTGQYTDARSADKLIIKPGVNYALLTENIYENDINNFDHISFGQSIDNLELLPSTSYRVDLDASVIWFDQGYEPEENFLYYAFYEGEGSIIWVEDVTSLQDIVKRIDEHTLYKDGGTMEGSINMGGYAISNVDTVDNIKISTHKHTGANYDAPPIDVTGLANDAVQTSKILDDAVTSDKIKDLDVQYFNLATNAVITDKLADDSVTNAKLVNNSIEFGKLNQNSILSGILNILYPVGAIYITTSSTCPIANYVGTWTLKSSGRVLQGADSSHAAGTTISAGIPNHYHGFGYNTNNNNGTFLSSYKSSGTPPTTSVTTKNSGGSIRWNGSGDDAGKTSYDHTSYNANMFTSLVRQEANTSTGGGVYTNTDTVQPAAYVVNIFERTA